MNSSLPKLEEMTDILDLKGMAIWDLSWLLILIGLILFFLIVGVVYYFYQARKNKLNNKAKKLNPIEEALERLNQLVLKKYIESGQIRPFYFILSEIFRHFLERELHIQAEEATQEELRPLLKKCPDLTQDEIKEALWLLEISDMAKFAKWVPPKDEIIKSVKTCRILMTTLARRREVLREEGSTDNTAMNKRAG